MQNTPRPFSFASSQTWSGNDGSWSTFVMRIGTPEQNFHVLPSTSGHETFIPFPEGCLSTDPENCGILRGTFPESQKQGFAYNESKTWSLIGIYSTDLREDLGYEANGMYGRETVGLQVQNSGGVTLEKQIVGGLASKDFFLGMFGLGIKPSNFTDFNYPQSSFISNLKDQNIIPSLSFAYNAGASYRMPKVPASLTLGGYDSTKFQSTIDSHALSFDPNDERSLSIGVQKVTAIKTLHGTVTLTDKAIYSLIDSTVPYLWLPRTVCDSFELSFGLTYDSTTELYLVNNTIRERLQELNPTITFSLGGTNDPSRLVNIELPYAAFDLQASWPIYPNTTNYFPIKRATNESQYTLGRAFLQEAYIIADYERSNFSIYQAVLDISKKPNIVPIISSTSVDGTREKNGMIESTNKNKLSRGAIAGISVGSILFAAAILYLMFFLWRRRQSQSNRDHTKYTTPIKSGHSMHNDNTTHEIYSPHGELVGDKINHEMESEDNAVHMKSDDMAFAHKTGTAKQEGDIPAAHELPVNDNENHSTGSVEVAHEMPSGNNGNKYSQVLELSSLKGEKASRSDTPPLPSATLGGLSSVHELPADTIHELPAFEHNGFDTLETKEDVGKHG